MANRFHRPANVTGGGSIPSPVSVGSVALCAAGFRPLRCYRESSLTWQKTKRIATVLCPVESRQYTRVRKPCKVLVRRLQVAIWRPVADSHNQRIQPGNLKRIASKGCLALSAWQYPTTEPKAQSVAGGNVSMAIQRCIW